MGQKNTNQSTAIMNEPPNKDFTRKVASDSIRAIPAQHQILRDRCTLTMLVGPTPGAIFTSEGNELLFGRGALASSRIHDPGLSRRHAKISREDNHYFLEDLNSTNGSFINGQRIQQKEQLRDGDRIQLGSNCLFQFKLHDAVEQDAMIRMYESSIKDPLTQVSNRRFLDERLQSEFAYAKRHQTSLSVLLIDIDHFKKVNDSLGHQGGDAVLQHVAKALKSSIRTEDMISRYGGEEFCIVARGIERKHAQFVAERLRKMIANQNIQWESHEIRVTISVGVATLDRVKSYDSVSAWVRAADDALYDAKDSGRNRVCVV